MALDISCLNGDREMSAAGGKDNTSLQNEIRHKAEVPHTSH